jgi:uncharacterized membrane protein YfcA
MIMKKLEYALKALTISVILIFIAFLTWTNAPIEGLPPQTWSALKLITTFTGVMSGLYGLGILFSKDKSQK